LINPTTGEVLEERYVGGQTEAAPAITATRGADINSRTMAFLDDAGAASVHPGWVLRREPSPKQEAVPRTIRHQ